MPQDNTGDEAARRATMLTVAEAASALRCSRRSIWRLMAEHELARVQVGRAVRIPRKSVEAFIAKGGAR